MAFDFSTLITDRSPEDLQALRDLLATPMADWTAEQLAQFNQAASKGAYNYTDLNRVIAAMDDINERLTAAGYVTGYQRIRVPHQGGGGGNSRLPSGYTELQYIESSGAQYINTGQPPSPNTRLTMMASFLSLTGSYVSAFGSRNVGVEQFWTFLTVSQNKFSARFGTETISLNTGSETIDTYDFNGNQITINGESAKLPNASFSSNYPIYICGTNNAGALMYGSAVRVYSVKIYENGAITRDFIPCENPSEEIGLYDLENDQFYGNAGSGAFTAGPEAVPSDPEPDPTMDPYTWYEEDDPTATQMQQYLSNVAALRGALELPENTVDLPANMTGLTQAEANAIEGVLGIINDYLEAMQRILLRSGMSWAISGGPNFYFKN